MSHWRLHFRYNFAPLRKGAKFAPSSLHPFLRVQTCTLRFALSWGCRLCTLKFAPFIEGANLHPQVCTLSWGCKLCTLKFAPFLEGANFAPSSLHPILRVQTLHPQVCTLPWGCKLCTLRFALSWGCRLCTLKFAPFIEGANLHPQVCTLSWGCKLCTLKFAPFLEGAKLYLKWSRQCDITLKVQVCSINGAQLLLYMYKLVSHWQLL